MKNKITCSVLSTLVLGLAGCGGGSDQPPSTGYLVGGLIEAVPYQCGEHQGRTGRLGEFTFDPAAQCVFTLGGITLHASAAALADRAVTPYELTRSATEAWTLMAILDSISIRRQGLEQFLIVDDVLAQRLPAVDLSQGDAAITAALAPFKGSTNPVSLQSGRERLGKFVDENNGLRLSLKEFVAEAEAALARLEVVESGEELGAGFGLHENKVNLRMYDHEGNWLGVNGVSYTPGLPGDWMWIPANQTDGYLPLAGLGQGDLTGKNIFGIMWYVGRHKTTAVADSFKARAYSPGSFAAPVTVLAHGVTDDEQNNSHFGDELNFGFHINLSVDTTAGVIHCANVMLAQGSATTSLRTYLDVAKDLGETIYKGSKFVDSEGADLESGWKALKSFSKLVKSAFKIKYKNWWTLGVNAQSESYRTTAWGNPAVLMQCEQNGALVTMLGFSSYDDHTFNLQVAFPGQSMTVQK